MLKLKLVELVEVSELPTSEIAEDYTFFFQDSDSCKMVFGDSDTLFVCDWGYDEEMWSAEFKVIEGEINKLESIQYFLENDVTELTEGEVYEF